MVITKEKSILKRSITGILVGMVLMLGGCGTEDVLQKQELPTPVPVETIAPTPVPSPEPTPIPTPTPFPEYDINLMMVGDNLMHMGIVNTGRQQDGSYNYDFLFEGISEFLEEAELKIINQETIFGGNELGFSGYPRFNSPTEIGDAMVKAGFNVVLHSSNHTADKGLEGILNCVEYWEQYPEMLVAGIYADEEKNRIPIIEIEGVTFAILNYAYAPNMESFPREYEGHMDLLCDYNEDTRRIDFTSLHEDVLADITEADVLADFVIVCPHWGTEYMTTPSKYQKKFATQMTEAGADIIIGTHPHVVQPVEWIEAENGNKALCYYSLGNYVSTQKQAICMLEGMAWVTIHVDEEGASIATADTGVVPLVCHYKANPVRLDSVYLLEEYTEEQATTHGIKIYGGVDLNLEELQQWSDEIFADKVLSAEQILEGME